MLLDKTKIMLLLMALLLGALPLSAQDVSDTIDQIFGLVTVDNADVRAGPDFAYPAIGQLPRDASVEILGRAGDFFRRWDGRQWLQIRYGDQIAWIYGRLVRTSVNFNSIFPTGRALPRNNNGRVPEAFDLSVDVCSRWRGNFTRSGDFFAGDSELIVTYPGLMGANVYSVIVIAPDGTRRAFDSETTTAKIILEDLPRQGGTYTWRVVPYWTNAVRRSRWQQVCLLQTGGTFEKPDTTPRRDE